MPQKDSVDRPLTPKEYKFVRFYVQPSVRDVAKAAGMANIPLREAKVVFKRPEVQEEINRRFRLVELEQAKLDAEAEVLPDSLIDQALAETMKLCPKEHGSTKLAAISLALVVKGRIETRSAKAILPKSAEPLRAAVYGSITPTALPIGQVVTQTNGQTTTTLRRTEEVIQTQAAPAAPALEQPAPFTFEVIER